jgi:signal transduction histidine kinase
MVNFCDIGTPWQIMLLILSLSTLIALAVACVLGIRDIYRMKYQIPTLGVLVANAVLYVVLQIDSRITGSGHSFHFPYIVVLILTILSFGYAVKKIRLETNNRKSISNTSIKEAFDNLPTGVCFFNESGIPVICNLAMQRFSFETCGKDIQFINDLENCLPDNFVPAEGTVKDGKVFTFADETAWQLEKRSISDERGMVYTQFVALDVTNLQKKRVELVKENLQLKHVQQELKRLSANVVAITREEEILNTKMRVHDEMGRCLLKAQKYLMDEDSEMIPESMLMAWQRVVSMLKYNNDKSEEDMLLQIRRTCEAVQLEFVQKGVLPEEERVAYLLTCAVRECVTNAVRYAQASELYVEFSENENTSEVKISNNGAQPEQEIMEGGGLSTLRRRVERAGGRMRVQSLPNFELIVTIPKAMEGIVL